MRLLHVDDSGELHLIDHAGRDTPPYAILSHTWGADGDEVTYKDIAEGEGKSKPGYRKLSFCAKQAASDGLSLFWVDTCCIDKTSSAELSEAINSMFRWYANASKCYVYLSDVSVDSARGKGQLLQATWVPSFQRSRWFTRGWTLQELLAPKSVAFYSAEGEYLGDRKSLVQEIQTITGINSKALEGSPLSHFSVEERRSWNANRDTKREEDAAYCLMGIFGVFMPAIYGEGNNAFKRLQKEIEGSLQRDEPSIHTNQALCSKCDRHGHLSNELHCYKCGEYGHYANEPHCYGCNSRDHIVSECTRWLDPVTRAELAEEKLLSLRQERSASEYATAFEKLASQLEWGDNALMSFFYKGLKYRVKDILYRKRKPDTLLEYMRMAVSIDVELDLIAKSKLRRGERK